MADNRNLVLQLLITAKDEASTVFGKLYKWLDDETSVVAGKVRDAFAGLFGGGLDSAMEFEAQMDRVAAKGGYTGREMDDLKTKTALLGSQFGVTGTEAAKGMEALAAAGLSASDAVNTLPPVLALAASEQISADAAAQKLIDSLSIMGLGFGEAGRMADVLAKGANITTSSAAQLAEALTQAGGMAKAAGMDLEETVAALDLLHKNGIKGSEAGTALKSILTSLLDPASTASQELNKLGISSRDLGPVMTALQAKGEAANAAILAFGTQAGPGLRALLTEGQGALDDMTLQLQNADGAAQDAADQMGGNLKSALAGLNSAWDSLKAALLEPLLQPIAKAANELTAAFQTALADGSIKGVQDLLKEFGTGIAEGIKKAVASFDFETAKTSINEFAASAKGSFEGVKAAGEAVSGEIQVAFNLITAPIKAVLASVAQTVGNTLELLATVEAQSAKVGLGTLQHADELMGKANAAKDTARDLMAAAKQDVADLTEGANKTAGAFDGVTDAMGKAREEADKAKPPDLGNAATLEPIKKSLSDYIGILKLYQADQDKATTAFLEAQAGFSQGKVSVEDYSKAQNQLRVAADGVAQAQRNVDVATQEAIRGIDKENAAVTAGVKTRQQRITEMETDAKKTTAYVGAVEGAVKAETDSIRASINLAQAKGDAAEVRRLTILLTEKEAAGAVMIARAYQAEQEAEAAIAVKKLELAQIKRSKNEITAQELALAELVAQKEVAEAQAAGVNAEAKTVLAQKLREVNAAAAGATGATQENTQATGQNNQTTEQAAEKTKKLAAANRDSTDILKSLVAMLNGARSEMKALSDNTEIYFDLMLAHTLDFKGFAGAYDEVRRQQERFNAAVSDANPELSKLRAGLEMAQKEASELSLDMINSANSFAAFEIAVRKAKAIATAAFNEQAILATELTQKYEAFAKGGAEAIGGIAVTMHELENANGGVLSSMNLLDQQRLDQLKGAIEAANEKLREMQNEAQDAQTALAEMNAEILAESGDEAGSKRLKLQIEESQKLAELEQKRMEAAASGNKDAEKTYQAMIEKAKELYALKAENLKAELEGNDQSTRAADKTVANANRIREAYNGINGVDLSGINGKITQLADAVAKLKDEL